MNVILLVIDCGRFDKFGAINPASRLTPAIDEFSQQATVFSQAVAQGNATVRSFPSLLTGAYPTLQRTSAIWNVRPNFEATPTLATLLRRAGLATAGFTSNPWISPLAGYGAEYDHYEANLLPFALKTRSALARRLFRALHFVDPFAPAGRITAQAGAWIKQQRRPFFAFIHLMDAHGPYPLGRRWPLIGHRLSWPLYHKALRQPATITPAQKERLEGGYDHGLRLVDEAWGRFQTDLQQMGVWDDSLIIITADHGEAFGEHGYYSHGHQTGFYDEVLRVPLLIRRPGQQKQRLVSGQVALTAIVPTILDVLGQPIPDHVQGKSGAAWLDDNGDAAQPVDELVFAHGQNTDNLAMVAVRSPNWKYIWQRNLAKGIDQRELYDLRTDPAEQTNCAALHADVAARLHEACVQHHHLCRAQLQSGSAPVDIDAPAAVERRLRDLGYFE